MSSFRKFSVVVEMIGQAVVLSLKAPEVAWPSAGLGLVGLPCVGARLLPEWAALSPHDWVALSPHDWVTSQETFSDRTHSQSGVDERVVVSCYDT